MKPAGEFEGFPERILTFFEELAQNNNKAWFDAHKADYEESVKEPALAFGEAMAERLAEMAAGRPPRPSVFRIYRDIRFSKDKTPYKTHLGIGFGDPGRKMGESPGFYFHLEAGRVMLGGGVHTFQKDMLEAYREAVADEMQGTKLARVLDDVRAKGYETWGETYKKVPRGYEPDHPRARLLRYSGLFAGLTREAPPELHTPALLDFCLEHYRAVTPVQEWLVKLESRL